MKRILALILALSLLCVPALGDETDSMLEKAEAFVEAGDFESAGICLDIAQKLSPDDPAVPRGFARLYAAEANYESALKFIEEALALSPADGSLYLEKARLLYITNNLNEAELVLRYAEICSALPDDELLLDAAQAYLRAGQYETVIELCENQSSEALRLQAARACDCSGQYERAVKLFETLPDTVWRNGYASAYTRALLRSGNPERAQALGLTSIQEKDEALAAAIADGKSLRLVPAHEALIDSLSTLPVFSSNTFAEENREAAEAEGFRFTAAGDGVPRKLEAHHPLSSLRHSFFLADKCVYRNPGCPGFSSAHTSSMYRWRGSFFFCSCLAFHARIFRKPGISMRSISSMRQPDSKSEL